MRKAIVFLLLGVFMVAPGVLFAASKRTAILEDTAGVATEVTGLRFFGLPHYFDYEISFGQIGVTTAIFELAIPVDSLMSIESKEDSFNVRYQWRGKEKTIIGKLMPGKFRGKAILEIWSSQLSS